MLCLVYLEDKDAENIICYHSTYHCLSILFFEAIGKHQVREPLVYGGRHVPFSNRPTQQHSQRFYLVPIYQVPTHSAALAQTLPELLGQDWMQRRCE